MRRMATSDRRMVTAAKLVYSTWKINPPGERHGKTVYRNRFAPRPVHLLRSAGQWPDLPHDMEAGQAGGVWEEAAIVRRGGRGDHRQYAIVLRHGGAAGGPGGGR